MKFRQNIAMGLGVLRGKFLSQNVPLSVMLSVTNRCNSKCRYCDISSRKQKEMSTSEMLNLIEQMSAGGVKKLSLWGGEPLLRDDIGAIITKAKDRGMCVNIDSNGYLVPEIFETIKDLDFIIFSFDGEKKQHDHNREPGAYDKLFRAIEFIDGRIPVWTLTVLTKYNIGSVDFILQKAREYRFKALFQVPYHPLPLGSAEDLLASADEYAKVFSGLARLKKGNSQVISSSRYLNAVSKWGFFPGTTSEFRPQHFPECWAGRMFCNIDTNGDMYTCSPRIGLHKQPPNVLKYGFAESFRRLKKSGCQSCVSGCSLETNFVFSLNIKSIREWLVVL